MLALLLLIPCAAPPPAEMWALVVAPDFEKAAAPLIAQRRAQGMKVAVVVASANAEKNRKALEALCRGWHGRARALLLGCLASDRPGRVVPAFKGSVSRMKGEPTDAPYGLPGADGLPTVAVGRLPARDEAEARAMIAKTLEVEKDSPGWWKREVNVLAGIPAFNPAVDRVVEAMAFARFNRLHPSWSGRAIYTNPSSRFTLPGSRLRHEAAASVSRGQAVLLYLGHSDATGLWGGDDPFLSRDDFARLEAPWGGGVFVTLGCHGCQLAGKDGEGYGVAAVRNPRGPAAVFGSHGVCFAAICQLAADGLFEKAFEGKLPARLGELHLAALEGVARGKIDFLTFRMLDAVDGDPKIPQAVQRREHLEMFVLLGDPALKLPQAPEDLDAEAPSTVRAGEELSITVRIPPRCRGGKVEARLERQAGSAPPELAPLPSKPGKEKDKALMRNHALANLFLLDRAFVVTRGDVARITLRAPARLPYRKLNLRLRCWNGVEESYFFRQVEVKP